LHPRFVEGLDWVDCQIDTIRGPVSCNWKRIGNRIALTLVVPVSTTAELSLPVASADAVTEDNHPAAASKGVTQVSVQKDLAAFHLASGTYRFEVRL
jgi:alpha-L-rhamnosidase